MKECRIHKRRASLLSALALIVSVAHIACNESGSFNFDRLFSGNAYSRATEQCVKVWGAWDAVLRSKSHSATQFTRTLDSSLGQLVLAHTILCTVPGGEKRPLAEQLHYMSRVIGTVADRFKQLPHMDAARRACLQKSIGDIQKIIEAKMKE